MDAVAIYKSKVRKVAMKISLSLVVFYAIYSTVTIAVLVLVVFSMPALPEYAEMQDGLMYLEEDIQARVTDQISLGTLSILTLFFGAFAMLILRGKKLFTTDLTKTAKRIKVSDFFMMAAIMLGINASINLFGLTLTFFAEGAGASSGAIDDIFAIQYMNFSGILYVVLLAPILEEIIFRGAILRSLEPFGQNFAIFVSSLAFGLYHLFLFQGIFAFFVGLIFGYCALKYSIKWAMLLHILNNGFAMLLTYLEPTMAVEASVFLVILVFAVVAAVFFMKSYKQQLIEGKPKSVNFVLGLPAMMSTMMPAMMPVAPAMMPGAPAMPLATPREGQHAVPGFAPRATQDMALEAGQYAAPQPDYNPYGAQPQLGHSAQPTGSYGVSQGYVVYSPQPDYNPYGAQPQLGHSAQPYAAQSGYNLYGIQPQLSYGAQPYAAQPYGIQPQPAYSPYGAVGDSVAPPKASPYALTFSSPWILTVLVLAVIGSILTTVIL